MMTITLYDQLPDVLRKACIGLDLEPAAVASKLGWNLAQLRRQLDARLPEVPLDELASATGLSAEGLRALGGDRPFPELPAWVERLELPFEDETVNAWRLSHDGFSLLVDAGLHGRDLLAALHGRVPGRVLITHPHRDHVGGLAALPSEIPNSSPKAPARLEAGPFEITVHDLAGHHPRAVGYELRLASSAEETVFLSGDAIFASSMGGCPDAGVFQTACGTIARAIRQLPEDTLILPGHGSATRVALERRYNPFFPCWERAGLTP
ncbi:MBL fold metallo-hydrolase [Haloferula sargassicola]|uniref:Hydroxyacylglutathione hydrolase n=1 Tax=Haloferula sargassicola TaxID=490096 RepID=A0ABP9UT25_9BACT